MEGAEKQSSPQELYKPVTLGRSSGVVRKQSLMTRTIEEKKEHLFLKQAIDYAHWISNTLGIPPMEPDLLTSLQNGIVLGLLIQKIAPEKLAEFKFPTNLKSVNVFQAHENIKRFLKACEVVGIKAEDTFQPEDLLDGQNKLKVLRTLQCLRKIQEGKTGGYEYEKFEKANFDLDFLEGERAKDSPESPTPPLRPRRNTIRLRVNESVKRRSLRLFQGPTDGFSSHFEPDSRKKRAEISDATFQPPAIPEVPPKDVGAISPAEEKPSGADSKGKLPLRPTAADPAQQGTVPFPSLEEGIIEIPILEKEQDDSFTEPMDPSIMAHLLSRDQGEASGSDDEPEEDAEETESIGDFEFEEAEEETEGDKLIASLRNEVAELQDLLKTEIVAHMKETELFNEQIKIAKQQLSETEKRAVEAEKRSRELEDKVHQLLVVLEERDQSLSLLSQLYNEQLKKVEEAVAQANSESQARSELEARIKAEEADKTEKKKEKEVLDQDGSKKKKTEKRPRRKSYVARKPKNSPDDPKLTHLDELEKELGISSPVTPAPPISVSENLQEKESPRPAEEEPEEEPAKPREVVEGPAGYEPFIPLERLASLQRQVFLWSHLPEVKAFTGKISERERARQEVIYELISTEEAYIADLELIIRLFMLPLYNSISEGGLLKEEYDRIFRNIQQLAQINVAFFKDLKKRQDEERPVIRSIADIVLKHIVYFGAYAEYCGDQKRSTFELKRIVSENAVVKGILESCYQKPECRKLDIFAFLLLPMQRLTKYPLLLKNLVKVTTESDADFDYIKAAGTELSRLINAVDQYAHRREELHRISEIDRQLNWSIVSKPVSLLDSEETGRFLVQEGLLTRLRLKSHSLAAEKKPSRKTEQLYCFFFNDMFIFTKQISIPEVGAVKYIVQVEPLLSGNYTVRNVPEATNGIGAKNVFLISSRATGTIVLQASSPEEKEKWIAGFRKEDLIVEAVVKFDEAGTLRKKSEPVQRYSSVDLSVSTDIPPSPMSQRHSTALIPSRSDSDSDYSTGSYTAQSPNVNPNLSIEQLPEPEFDGWLKILTRGAFQTSSWKLRWCVLKDFCLYYFPDDHLDSKALGMVVLPSYRIVSGKESNKKNVFKIEHPTGLTKPLVCCADTMEYFDVWVQALTHATMAKVVRRNFWL